MKFRWDKKYLYWGITLLLVVIGGIGFYYLIFHSNSLKTNLFKLFSIMTPIIDGLILSYLLWPVLSLLERKILHPLRDVLLKRFPKLSEKKLNKWCRALSILGTLFFVFLVLTGFFRIVIPQIATSIQNIISQFDTYVKNLSGWLEKVLANNPEIGLTAISWGRRFWAIPPDYPVSG